MKNKYKECSDAELIDITLNDDCDAYSEIVRRYKNSVFKTALAVLRNYQNAEDIAQESFIDGYLKLRSLEDPSKIASWLCRITRNKSYNYISRLHTCADLESVDSVPGEYSFEKTPESLYIEDETKLEILSAVNTLSDKIRSVVVMHYFKDYPVERIASQLEIPEGTVKRRLHDARTKLKKELMYMSDTEYKLSDDFESKIAEKIKQIKNYYHLNGDTYDGFDSLMNETLNMINNMPESKMKQNAYADVYLSEYYRKSSSDKELYKKVMESAEKGGNADVVCSLFIEDIINGNDDNLQIKRIEEEALPKIEKMNSLHNKGILLFWKATSLFRLKNLEAAKSCFTDAVNLINKDNIYYANAVGGLKAIDIIEQATDGIDSCNYTICGEGLRLHDGKVSFVNQPGFGGGINSGINHRFESVFYHVSRCNGLFFDENLAVGESVKDRDETVSLVLVAKDETVRVSAGEFSKCMHLNYNEDKYSADIWYAYDIGLIKVVFTGYGTTENYELREYNIIGGTGYFPMCAGNKWRYYQPLIPSYNIQYIEREIITFDGEYANFLSINLLGLIKDYESVPDADSDLFIGKADKFCGEWKLDEAIDSLKTAVRKNTTQQASIMALAGIDYLKHCKEYLDKKYRFCPSSINGSKLMVKDGSITYDESGFYSFGPYRWGSRHAENKIFGVKPFRYLDQLFGRIYDSKWVAGYSESKKIEEGITASLKAEDAGTVSVKAGTFENCIKVTIEAELEGADKDYYFKDFSHVFCGKKEYWYAPDVGIVKHVCTWGSSLNSVCELSEYNSVSVNGEYMPVYIGTKWVYDETTLEEGYRARRTYIVASGVGNCYFLVDEQQFLYLGTEEEYEEMKKKAGM